jgi:putative SOS response-associated peptidase YedK
MCGRFTLSKQVIEVPTLFDQLESPVDPHAVSARYNIAPTQNILIVRHTQDGRRRNELVEASWGLSPTWSEDRKFLMNARCETIHTLPSFREDFRTRRCLIPADGFFEWKGDGKKKQPYYIFQPDHPLFCFAGLWETWKDDNGQEVDTCAIVTTQANDMLRPLHERMPVIVPSEMFDHWMDVSKRERDFQELFRPLPNDALRMYPVSTLVNGSKVDSPDCIREVALEPSLFGD